MAPLDRTSDCRRETLPPRPRLAERRRPRSGQGSRFSFSLRLWAVSIGGFTIFGAWVFLHDDLLPGIGTTASHSIVVAAAWLLVMAATLVIDRLHRRAEGLAEAAARDETVIQLAGGVAHELNQPLTIIITTSELLARRDPAKHDPRPHLHQLIQASERMSDVVQKLERATSYRSKPYVGEIRIVDIDGSSQLNNRG